MRCLATVSFVLCMVVGYAQIPPRCTSPDTWEARIDEVSTSQIRTGRIYYDATNERIAFKDEVYDGDTELSAYTEYLFFKLGYGLRFNDETKQCTRFLFNETFHKFGVPPTARYVDTLVIGTNAIEKYGLTVTVWADDFGENGRSISEFVYDDEDGDEHCLPVAFTEFGGGQGSRGFRQQSFFDVVLGVNPSHFIPPEQCI